MISQPRYRGQAREDEWTVTLHDEEDEPDEFVSLIKKPGRNWICFEDDSNTEVTFQAEDIDDLIQALTALKAYI